MNHVTLSPVPAANREQEVCRHCGCAIAVCPMHGRKCCVQHCKGDQNVPFKQSDDDRVVLEGKIVRVSAKAKLIEWTNTGEESWVPKSQIVSEEEVDGDGNINFTLTGWFAKKEGLV